MDRPNNTLNNIKSIFAWKRIRYLLVDVPLIARKRLAYQKSLLKTKKLSATSKSTAREFSPLHRDPVVDLRKNHPLFVKYHFRLFEGGQDTMERRKLVNLPPGKHPSKVVNAIIEIPKGNNHGNITQS